MSLQYSTVFGAVFALILVSLSGFSVLRFFASVLAVLYLSGFALGQTRIEGAKIPSQLQTQLRAALPDTPKPESLFEARRQAKVAAARLNDYLNSQGYFAPDVTPSIITEPLAGIVTISPGPKFKLGAINITYEGAEPPEKIQVLMLASLSLKPGMVALPDKILSAEARLISILKENSYADAHFAPREIIGDRKTAEIDVTFRLNTGPSVRLGDVIYDTPVGMQEKWRDRLIPFKEGDLYSPDTLMAFTRNLGNTRAYSLFAANLNGAPNETAQDGTELRDVHVTLTERPRHALAVGVSFSTAEGPGTTLELTRRDATRRGDTLRFSTILAKQEQTLGLNWDLPNGFGRERNLSTSFLGGRENTDAFERFFGVAGVGLELTPQEHLTVAFGSTVEFSSETDLTNLQRNLGIVSASAGARLDYTDNLLDPTSGWRSNMRIEPGFVFGDTDDQFISTLLEGSVYHAISSSRNIILAGRAAAGAVFGAGTLELPTSRRFFAGGGGSARGFGFQDVGPRDANNTPIGGRGLFELSGEARWRYNETFGFAAFLDAASVSEQARPTTTDIRYGAGIGVRYYTAIGPIRFDIATPINPQAGDNPVQVYISIGQAF